MNCGGARGPRTTNRKASSQRILGRGSWINMLVIFFLNSFNEKAWFNRRVVCANRYLRVSPLVGCSNLKQQIKNDLSIYMNHDQLHFVTRLLMSHSYASNLIALVVSSLISLNDLDDESCIFENIFKILGYSWKVFNEYLDDFAKCMGAILKSIWGCLGKANHSGGMQHISKNTAELSLLALEVHAIYRVIPYIGSLYIEAHI